MSAWLRHHVRCLLRSALGLAREPISSLLNILVIGAALALPLAGFVALENLKRLTGGLAADPQLSVYFVIDAARADIERVETAIKSAPAARQVRFVSKDEALAMLRQDPTLTETIKALKSNPLPDAYVVHLAPGAGQAAEELAAGLRKLPKVAHVQLDIAWVKRLDAILELVRVATLVLSALLAAALVAVTFNTIRLQIARNLESVELSRLIGATDGYVRRPFLYLGAWLGLLGAAVGVGVVLALLAILAAPVHELAELYAGQFELARPSVPAIAATAAVGLLLGWIGASISASVYLHTKAPTRI